jgi:hypothetical protein
MQLLYFRQAMNTPSNAGRNAKLEKILSVEPGTYNALLMQGIIMNILGRPQASSDKVFSDIESDLSLKDGFNKRCVKFLPSKGQSSFNGVNSFVVHPFYVYFFQK